MLTMTEETIRLGISSCLLGNPVRYDGGHKHDRLLTDSLGAFVEFVPVCPEVEAGLGVPRETMRLVGDPARPRLLTTRSRIDHTALMEAYAARRVRELEAEGLCGFIFKSRSPSSGMERVKVYNESGQAEKKGVGLFARAFMEHFPLLPVEEDGRLHDIDIRENFIERIFVYRRWRTFRGGGAGMGAFVDFHTDHKLLLMAHSPDHYRRMGKLVASGRGLPPAELFDRYERLLMEALTLKATVRKNVNVLQHMMGYFKKVLSPDEKRELLEVIDHYHREFVPLIVPVTLMNHYARKYGEAYLARQHYLHPHPLELKLRNHA